MITLVILLLWALLLVLTELRRDIIYAVMSLFAAGCAMSNATITAVTLAGVESVTLATVMGITSIYMLLRTLTVRDDA